MSAHVAPRGGKWAVRMPGKERAWRVFADRAQAIDAATKKALPVYVYDKGGRLERVIRSHGVVSLLPTPIDEGAEACIAKVRELLAILEETPHRSVVICAISKDGEISTGYTAESRTELLGHLHMMMARVAE